MDPRSWHTSYAAGVPTTLTYDRTTVSAAFSRSAKNFPDHPALNYMGRTITYSELESMVRSFARVLSDMGIGPGDKVAVCLPNIPQAIIANYAVFRIGAVAVLCNPLYTERELAYQLNDSDAKIIVTLTLLVPRVEKIRDQTKIKKIIACHIHSFLPFPKKQLFPLVKKEMFRKITPTDTVKLFTDLIRGKTDDPVVDKSRWEDVAALLYTGGTTGVSKGVMLTHANLSCNVQQFVAWFPDLKKGEESLVGNFPVFHSAGFTAIQNFCLWQAYEIILVPRPEPAINIEILKKYHPTFLPGVPTIFVGLLADPAFRKLNFSSIKGFFSGAAPLGRRHHSRTEKPDWRRHVRSLRVHGKFSHRVGHPLGRTDQTGYSGMPGARHRCKNR